MNIKIDWDSVKLSESVEQKIRDQIKSLQHYKDVTSFHVTLSHQPTKAKEHAFKAKVEANIKSAVLVADCTSDNMHKCIAFMFVRLESQLASRKQKIEEIAKRGNKHRGVDIAKAGGSLRQAAGY